MWQWDMQHWTAQGTPCLSLLVRGAQPTTDFRLVRSVSSGTGSATQRTECSERPRRGVVASQTCYNSTHNSGASMEEDVTHLLAPIPDVPLEARVVSHDAR